MNGLQAAATPQANARATRPQLKFSMDWITRPVFGLLLGAITLAAVYEGKVIFAIFGAAVVVIASREWHRMITPDNFRLEVMITGITVLSAAFLEALHPGSILSWFLVIGGAFANFCIAARRSRFAVWHSVGVIYLAVPALALILLRLSDASGFWLVVLLLAAIWASDTGALIAGNLIGGPKLCPSLSPNKTWSGFLGGIASAVLVSAVLFAFLRRDSIIGALLGAGISLAGHAGDLFESWAKRKFKIKNSGSLIPGHGGMLDRVDSTLFAAPVLALIVLIVDFNPLAGTHP